MVINPYLPDMKMIEKSYQMAQKEDEREIKRHLSLIKPYRSEEEIVRELSKDPISNGSIFAKMSNELRKDQEVMLKLIEKDPSSYLYIHKELDTLEFKKLAIDANPLVYKYLSDQDRENQQISDRYLKSMENYMTRKNLDGLQMSMQYDYRFSDKTNLEQVFSYDRYKKAYENMVINGAQKNGVIGRDFTLVSTARLLLKDEHERFNQIEREVWLKHKDRVEELARNDRGGDLRIEHALEAVEERCPEYQPVIEKKAKEYWEEKRDQLLELQERDVSGQILNEEQNRILTTGLKYIEIEKREETKRRLNEKREENRRIELAELKQRAIDETYSRAASGDISYEMAHDVASYVEAVPSTVNSNSYGSIRSDIIAKSDDIQNIDIENNEIEQEVVTEIDCEYEQENTCECNQENEYERDYGDIPSWARSDSLLEEMVPEFKLK